MSNRLTKLAIVAAAVLGAAVSHADAALIHYWQFNNSIDNAIPGGATSGTLLGGAGFTASQVAPGIGSTHALNLSGGSDEEFAVTNSAERNALQATLLGDFTISFWARSNLNATSLPNDIAQMFDFGETHGSGIGVFFNRSHSAFDNGAIAAYTNSTFSTPVTGLADQWYHIVMQRDGDDVNVFVDGELEATSVVTSPSISTGRNFVIGGEAKSGNRNWLGQIDDFGIFDAPLTADEVRLIANVAAEQALPLDLGTMALLFERYQEQATFSLDNLPGMHWTYDDSALMSTFMPGTVNFINDQYFLNVDGTSGLVARPVPEPATLVLVGMLLPAGWYFQRLRKRRAAKN